MHPEDFHRLIWVLALGLFTAVSAIGAALVVPLAWIIGALIPLI